MLRIGQTQEGKTIVVQVEGRLAGPWVEELRRVLAAVWGTPSAIALDLTSVGYVDAVGERLLRDAIARGAHIRRSSSFVAALLEASNDGGPR